MFKLPYISTSDELIDKSFRKGSKEFKKHFSTRKTKAFREKKSEKERIRIIAKTIRSDLDAITDHFPTYEKLNPFYQRLLDIKISKDLFKKSLGAVKWCSLNVKDLTNTSLRELRLGGGREVSKKYLGRVSSFISRIEPDLENLVEIKLILLDFPNIKDLPTLVIAGYPNAGKSTFLRNLTGSKVEINIYPFTTKRIQLGYTRIKYQTFQIIDLPGLLDRPEEDRNKIEQEAMLAIKELADTILFLFDPLQETKKQLSLLNEIKNKFNAKLFVCVNKMDAVGGAELKALHKELKKFSLLELSAMDSDDCVRVFEKIMS